MFLALSNCINPAAAILRHQSRDSADKLFFRPASALNSKPEKPLDLIYSFLPLFFYRVTYIPSSLLLSSDPEIVQNKQMGSSQNIFCLEKPSPSGREGEREGGKERLIPQEGECPR